MPEEPSMRRMECILVFPVAALLGAGTAVFAQTPPASLLQSPAAPAVLSLSGGQLTIRAKNSSLRSILDRLQTMTGAKIEGLGQDERIFGVYGPGDPQKVLAQLLDSSRYNVLIAGRRPDGAPREIVLSTPSALPAQPAGYQRPQQDSEDEQGDSGYANTPVEEQPVPPPRGRPGNQTPRTAQQMLQELQRMRQQANPANDQQ
jgi:hypothetical protein